MQTTPYQFHSQLVFLSLLPLDLPSHHDEEPTNHSLLLEKPLIRLRHLSHEVGEKDTTVQAQEQHQDQTLHG